MNRDYVRVIARSSKHKDGDTVRYKTGRFQTHDITMGVPRAIPKAHLVHLKAEGFTLEFPDSVAVPGFAVPGPVSDPVEREAIAGEEPNKKRGRKPKVVELSPVTDTSPETTVTMDVTADADTDTKEDI